MYNCIYIYRYGERDNQSRGDISTNDTAHVQLVILLFLRAILVQCFILLFSLGYGASGKECERERERRRRTCSADVSRVIARGYGGTWVYSVIVTNVSK